MNHKKLIIIGAGGMGREVLQWIKDINSVKALWDIQGFIDDDLQALDGKKCDYNIIGNIANRVVHTDEYYALAIASPTIKEKIVSEFKKQNANFATIIHPTARIGLFNEIGEGAIIYPNASISVNVKIGSFVTLLGSTIGHDASIGNYSSIMGTCNINGNVTLGERVFLGCQTVTVPGKKIGNDAYVCAGSVVMTNIKAKTKVMGMPAKKFDL